MPGLLRLLLLTPDADTAGALMRLAEGAALDWTYAARLEEAAQPLTSYYDVILFEPQAWPQRGELPAQLPTIRLGRRGEDELILTAEPAGESVILVRSSLSAALLENLLQYYVAQRAARLTGHDTVGQALRAAELTGDGVMILTPQGVIQQVNAHAERLFGRPADQLMGAEIGFPVMTETFSTLDLVRDEQPVTVEMRVTQVEWEGQPALLAVLHDITQHARDARASARAQQFAEAVLNALTAHIAVLDSSGVIVAVNRAWEEFAVASGATSLERVGAGANYFDICQAAADAGDVYAQRALAGMQAVLAGQVESFELEYPCDAPDTRRWFMMRATRLAESAPPGLVIAHVDVTQARRDAIAQAELEGGMLDLEEQRAELLTLEALAASTTTSSASASLRETMPEHFHDLALRCMFLLDRAVERRLRRDTLPISDDLRALAEFLGSLKAGPRDVIDIYLGALRERTRDLSSQKAQIYAEEGRLLVLELMGYLAAFYRAYLPPVMRA